MPYCLNHKISLSLGNKGAPEREEELKERREKHKAYLIELITCLLSLLRERAFRLAFLSSHFGTAGCTALRQLLLSSAVTVLSFGSCFCCGCEQFAFKSSLQCGIKIQCVQNVGQNSNLKGKKRSGKPVRDIREQKWFP